MTRRIKEWLRTPLDFEPGTDEDAYSNLGYEVLGEVIRRFNCTGEEVCPTYSDFIGALLADQGINPTRMRTGRAPKAEQGDSETSHIDYYNIYHNIAYDNEACRVSSSFPEVPNEESEEYIFPLVAAPDGGNTIMRDRANSNAGLQSNEIGGNAASGGWLGTADDYARFISCMANDGTNNDLKAPCGTLLYGNAQPQPPEFFTQKPSYMDADDTSGYYGSGVGISQSTGNWTHSGAWHGASSQFIRMPQDNGDVLTVVLLANTRPLFSSYGCSASSDRSEPVQRQVIHEKPFTRSQKYPSGNRPGDDDDDDQERDLDGPGHDGSCECDDDERCYEDGLFPICIEWSSYREKVLKSLATYTVTLDPNISTESAEQENMDINGDGIINVLDAVLMINLILEDGTHPTFSDLQKLHGHWLLYYWNIAGVRSADANLDGNVNVLDLTTLVNQVLSN
jgi:CubicO group peptidase (beta-lactamase class C family)